jgi:lipid A disaccharide synthetase
MKPNIFFIVKKKYYFVNYYNFIKIMQVYQNQFIKLIFEAENSLLRYISHPNTQEMTGENYKENMLAYAEQVEQYQPTRLLVDSRASEFVIVPELQEWTANVIAPRTTSLKKIAFVLNPDIFAQVALQQMMDEKGIVEKYEAPQYFENLEEAEKWILS